jgi:type II secretory pathway component PulF
MSSVAVKGVEEIVTDYQFRSIIRMILSIAESKGDIKAVIKELKKLLEEKDNSEQIEEK